MEIPSKIVEKAVYEISKLPGIGKKSALRLTLHLLNAEKEQITALAQAIQPLATDIQYCENCHNISDTEICEICANTSRESKTICVVEDVRDVMAIENTQQFKGKYHVLGGIISPMDGIGPSQLKIDSLIKKVAEIQAKEIIFALSSTMEGDTTMFYIFRQLKRYGLEISTLARGVAVGNELAYADELTLGSSILNRIPYETVLKK